MTGITKSPRIKSMRSPVACMYALHFAQAASTLFIYVALHTSRKHRYTDSSLPNLMIIYIVKYIPYIQSIHLQFKMLSIYYKLLKIL